jgi:hypothetical protein
MRLACENGVRGGLFLIVYALLAAIACLGAVTLTSAIVESHRRRT